MIIYDPKNYEIKKYIVSSVSDRLLKPRTKVFDGVRLEDLEWEYWGDEISQYSSSGILLMHGEDIMNRKGEGWKELRQ